MLEALGRADHPRTLGWVAATALAMGGSNQSLFLITALFAGQGDISGQGSAAVPLLIIGLLLAWVAAPGWTELVLMYPKRVGGIAATCAEAFRPYNPVLANLTGVCYWWGWVPTCGLTAIFSGAAIHEWYLPDVPVTTISCSLVLFFAASQPVRREMGRKTCDSDRDGIGAAGAHLCARADRRRRGGLATGDVVPPDSAVRRVVR